MLWLPILRGPLKGKRWLLATRLNFFLGTYEPEQTAAFLETVNAGDVVYDIGAHCGYYALLASGLVGQGMVFAFEPSPGNVRQLRFHCEANQCANVTILETAISDYSGNARFDNQAGSGVGHLSATGAIEVPVTTLDALVARLPLPTVIKIDVEGEEVAVLEGARQVIAKTKPAIFLSTHGDDLRERCLRFLQEFGYRNQFFTSGDLLATAVVSLAER